MLLFQDRWLPTFVLLGIVVGSATCSKGVGPAAAGSRYMGQSPPGETLTIFAPGLVSTSDAVELNGVFSPDLREFFFTRMTRVPSGDRVFRMYRSVASDDGSWSAPEQVPVYPDNAPSLAVDMAYSPDGRRLYFLGRHPHPLSPDNPGSDIWVSERTSEGHWSLAVPVPPPVWTEESESYPSFAPDGTLQFSSRRPGGFGESDLWRAPLLGDGEFGTPVNLSEIVNSEYTEGDSCVAPDGSYIVLTSGRPGGYGNGDLYVSFRDPCTGAWNGPVNLGGQINSGNTDYCPMITPDGRFLFFSRRVSDPIDSGWEGVTAGDVYWVDTKVIERFRE